MKNLDRTRIIFLIIVIGAILIVGITFGYNQLQKLLGEAAQTNSGDVVPEIDLDSPDPIFSPNYEPDDGLPTYICGADAFGSYFVLQQMQMSGKDIEHGFHIGISLPVILYYNRCKCLVRILNMASI